MSFRNLRKATTHPMGGRSSSQTAHEASHTVARAGSHDEEDEVERFRNLLLGDRPFLTVRKVRGLQQSGQPSA